MKKLHFRPAKFSRKKANLGFYKTMQKVIKITDVAKFIESLDEIGHIGFQPINHYQRRQACK